MKNILSLLLFILCSVSSFSQKNIKKNIPLLTCTNGIQYDFGSVDLIGDTLFVRSNKVKFIKIGVKLYKVTTPDPFLEEIKPSPLFKDPFYGPSYTPYTQDSVQSITKLQFFDTNESHIIINDGGHWKKPLNFIKPKNKK